MANYKIKDLQQASSLNGAIAFEIQDGNNKSTFATLDQIAEFLGNNTPVVLRAKRSGEGGYLPDMTIAEITAAYAKIVADPVHNIPVVSIPDAGGQYLLPSGYNTNVGLNSILGHYYSPNYVQPYVLELTNSTFTFGRNGGNKDVKIGELAVSSGVSIAYMDIVDGDTSENIADLVGGPVSFHETCNALKLSTIAAGFRFSSKAKTAYIPIATDVSISGDVYTLSLEYEKEAVVTRLQVREQNGVFSATRTDYSIPDLETDFTEHLSRLEIALRAIGADLINSIPMVVIAASSINRNNSVAVPIGAVAAGDKLSLSLGLIKITSGAPSGFSFALVDAAGNSIANGLTLQGQLTGTFTVHTAASAAQLVMYAGKSGATLGVGVEYDTVMLVRGDIPASALSLLGVLNRSKTYTDGIAAGKADLDPETGYVPSSQIAPLQGRQTGVQVNEGAFSSTAAPLLIKGDISIEALFTLYPSSEDRLVYTQGTNRTSRTRLYATADNRIGASYRGGPISEFHAVSNTPYHIVLTKDSMFVNGARLKSMTPGTGDPIMLMIGSQYISESTPSNIYFKGIIHSVRLFKGTLSASEVADLWNDGAPQDFTLLPSGAMRVGLVAEYIPAGLLTDKWRDTSGNGLDMSYVPTGAGGTAELDYQQPLLTPSGSPLHELFVAAGAVWDNTTKSWTVADYTGIDTPTMTRIYCQSHNQLNRTNWNGVMMGTSIPVNLPPRYSIGGYNGGGTDAVGAFAASKFEQICVAPADNAIENFIDCRNMFRNNPTLRKIYGIVRLVGSHNLTNSFFYDSGLETVRIEGLNTYLDLRFTPRLSLGSMQYIVDNASNTRAIGITVHADVYAKLTDPTNTEWYAVNAAAQAKQISFETE